MRTTADFVTKLQQFKQQYSAEYGIERIGIFGSVARGEQTEQSDLDICVEMKKPDMFLLIELKEKLQTIFDGSVDVVRLRKNMNPLLLNRINEEALYV